MTKRNFVICGLTGWCIEVAFTSMCAIGKKDKKLMGQTSAWMFPIYGMASIIGEISPKISHWHVLKRGLLYGTAIMAGEYISGSILKSLDVCPWNYDNCKYSIKGLVRPDFLPLWMLTGLLYEKILSEI